MSSARAAVVVFPGSNREGDFIRAWRLAHGETPATVWHDDSRLPADTDLVVLPGGFSYGDYLRCGAIAARARVMDAVRDHAARGGLVLGICNGFQILCEAGLLPQSAAESGRAPGVQSLDQRTRRLDQRALRSDRQCRDGVHHRLGFDSSALSRAAGVRRHH